MFIRIAGIQLKRPLLQWIKEPDGGLQVYCKATEGDCDESGAKKLLAIWTSEGFTGLVRWEAKDDGVEDERTMWLRFAKMQSKKTPDGKKITHYNFTLVDK